MLKYLNTNCFFSRTKDGSKELSSQLNLSLHWPLSDLRNLHMAMQQIGSLLTRVVLRMQNKETQCRAVVVAQLVERWLPIPEVRGSNPVIGKNLLILNNYWILCIEKTKNKEKEAGNGPFKKKKLGLKCFMLKPCSDWPRNSNQSWSLFAHM